LLDKAAHFEEHATGELALFRKNGYQNNDLRDELTRLKVLINQIKSTDDQTRLQYLSNQYDVLSNTIHDNIMEGYEFMVQKITCVEEARQLAIDAQKVVEKLRKEGKVKQADELQSNISDLHAIIYQLVGAESPEELSLVVPIYEEFKHKVEQEMKQVV